MRSLHLELLKDFIETERDLGRAMEREERTAAEKPVLWYSIDRVEYAAQLRRYHDAFSPEQVLVLIYDDFRADNEGTLRQVLRHIGVEEDASLEASEANQTVMVRSPRMYGLMRSLYMGRGPAMRPAKAAIKAVTPRRLRHEGLRRVRDGAIYGTPPPPDEELMRELRLRYLPQVRAVSEYLGRDLVSLWGYDRLG